MTEQQLEREFGINTSHNNPRIREADKIKYYPICEMCGVFPKESYSRYCRICNRNKNLDD